jgi:hypothetical protein
MVPLPSPRLWGEANVLCFADGNFRVLVIPHLLLFLTHKGDPFLYLTPRCWVGISLKAQGSWTVCSFVNTGQICYRKHDYNPGLCVTKAASSASCWPTSPPPNPPEVFAVTRFAS